MSVRPLSGITVVSVEQAVAAPLATSAARFAELGRGPADIDRLRGEGAI
jgi:crotonobetainyl-CoA:carnitine CoA-transferase CaiB-like acyl-CoA transferase